MNLVDQTIFEVPGGNCFAACIATVLGLSIDEVPNFCALPPDWWERTQKWLGERGLGALEFRLDPAPKMSPLPEGALCVLSGKSPRGGYMHSVVGRSVWPNRWEFVHDPHPDRKFLDGNPREVLYIVNLKVGRN